MQLHLDISVCLTTCSQSLNNLEMFNCSKCQCHRFDPWTLWLKDLTKDDERMNMDQCTSMMINVHNFLALHWTLFITRDSPGTPTFSAVQPGRKREAQRRHFHCCITFERCEIKTNNSNT